MAGAIGAPARYLVDNTVSGARPGPFPLGTFVVNVSGSLALGFITGLALYHSLPTTTRIVLGSGFCGAYTTFSTFTFETVRLMEAGAVGAALRNVAATVVVCGCGAAAGLGLATLI